MAYATLDELKGRLDWELDEDELRIGASALEDASDLAAEYGRDWATATAPRLVKTLVLKAAARYVRNPHGYTQSRAGDETLAWGDVGRDAGSVYFTREETRLLAELAGRRPGLTSAPIIAWGTTPRPGGASTVPVDYGGDPFPLYGDAVSPW
ncbi:MULTISPECIES: hypothetical protein [Streptomyces]|uniref:hypothetical protein n=1 Tax=Streptomyces TaxID=1883 RepID=UPI00226D92FA|nr:MULTISPECIES: hypothetical protein [unclassified Streptomyces]MCY0921668.1 hypothetical protein [Streptomyces sp. H27-G5]MCY0944001.1 hypothetical protein [Streptomyces sp. H34-AA3]MCY0956279.1 hypothetical protein [Streptomyces sp. H27-H5]MCZ4082299.1 hypothetical protein [Streptomyces sp. H34-S5]